MLSPAIPIDEKISHFESKLLNNVITTPLLARPRKQTPCLNPTKVQPIVVNLRIHVLLSPKIVIKMSRIDCHKAPRLILHTPFQPFLSKQISTRSRFTIQTSTSCRARKRRRTSISNLGSYQRQVASTHFRKLQ